MLKKIGLALFSGLLLALSWPTYGFPLLIFVGFVPLLFLSQQFINGNKKRTGGRFFGYSFIAFFIFNIITTFWLYYSTAFGMVVAVLLNTTMMSLVLLFYHWIAKKANFTVSSVFLVSLWICFEKLHLSWQLTWPWLNLGNVFSEYYPWIQWYSFTGTFGGTLWVWTTNIFIFRSVLLYQKYRESAILKSLAVKLVLLIGVPIGISYLLYFNKETSSEKNLNVVILQPNINPYTEKYHTTDTRVGDLLLKLTQEKITDSTDLVVAPETVFADGTELKNWDFSTAKNKIESLVFKHPKLHFLGGISMHEKITDETKLTPQTNFFREGLWYNDFNSAFMVSNKKNYVFYHKSKLVAGVESFPYKGVLEPIFGNVMVDLGGTVAMKTTQENRAVFEMENDAKVGPIICYESVFGEFVTGYSRDNQANLLTIITNDAWWDNTQGHQQHLSYARLRAIENNRTIVRSANTGISAVILNNGEIIEALGYEKQGSIAANVPLFEEVTFYTKYGDYIARISIFLALFTFLFSLTRRRNQL
ncbi:apolipoprotein N-acyltransferase [Mesonia sp. K7]|uniref:apolipoprotein N-acyltransferase n=1 Tax=Mesonia sp. K7 TaxID=2218606 RepID=UPI000DA9AD0D|nr:apolipoprotein N-acyltransferase [Mesonia sp. K7]PZD79510.1 apolipoprotein N-acyltransferase [Mesonia sp. K7]